jgi:peptidyl-prolyl cis-trans isomerase C
MLLLTLSYILLAGAALGWAPAEAYVKEFSEALTKLTPGQVTANPVKTQFGWHIIQLVDARTQQGPSFDELKPQLAQRIQGAQLDAYLSKLKQQAKVE